MNKVDHTKNDLVEAHHGDYARKLNYLCSQETIDHYIKFFKTVRGDDLIDWERLKVYFRAQHDPYLVGKEYATSFDLNKNEVIDVDEFHLLMKTIRLHDPVKFENMKPIDYDEFLRKVDTNKDGKVSVKELIAWLDKVVDLDFALNMSMAVAQLEPLRVSDQYHQFVTNFEFQELKTKIDQTTQKFETLVSWIWYRFGYNEPTFPEILRPFFHFEEEDKVSGSSPQCSEPQRPSPTSPAPPIDENVILAPEFEQEAESFSKNDVEVEPEDLEDILGTETEESLENENEPLSLSQQEQIATLTKPCFVSLIRLITLSAPASETELSLPHSDEIEIIELETSESEPSESKNPVARPICETRFNRRENQFNDMKAHSEDRLHTCEICDKGFKKLSNLKAHLETHSAPKPFKCEHEGCGRTYKYERHLANHFGTHVNGTQRFDCEVCGRTYLKKSSLKDHLRNHTPETPYTCTICGASFSQQCQWQRHNAMVHPGQKPFNCDVCGKGFIQRGQLQTHSNVHKMGEKEYCCEVCKSGKIFSWRELHQHFEFFHGDK